MSRSTVRLRRMAGGPAAPGAKALILALVLGLALVPVLAPPLSAGPPPAPVGARAGLDIAREAARSWAVDAKLVYVENDEALDGAGGAARWGYLFHSRSVKASRGYSVCEGRIREAADLGFGFEAPPLPDEWIDSAAALAAADGNAGDAYCREYGGKPATMLLIRGAFDERNPDAATWTVVYTSDSQPSLMVVVDAAGGDVLRTLKG